MPKPQTDVKILTKGTNLIELRQFVVLIGCRLARGKNSPLSQLSQLSQPLGGVV